MRLVCKILFFGLLLAYLAALALLLIGTYGWFGSPRDPLAGVFLAPLGLPWTMLLDALFGARAWIAIVAPLINLAILYSICRMIARPGRGVRK